MLNKEMGSTCDQQNVSLRATQLSWSVQTF